MKSVSPGLALAASQWALPVACQLSGPRLKLPIRQSETESSKQQSRLLLIQKNHISRSSFSHNFFLPLSSFFHGSLSVKAILVSQLFLFIGCPSVTTVLPSRLSFCHGCPSVTVVLLSRMSFCHGPLIVKDPSVLVVLLSQYVTAVFLSQYVTVVFLSQYVTVVFLSQYVAVVLLTQSPYHHSCPSALRFSSCHSRPISRSSFC